MSQQTATLPVSGPQALLAHRYMRALYSLAEQEGAIDAVADDMRNLRRLWNESAEWRFIAVDPRLDNKLVASATAKVIELSAVSALTGKFLSVAAHNRRLALLPLVIEGFLEEVANRRGEFRAAVRTAHALSKAQHDALALSLSAVIGGKVQLSVVEDPSIIGGLTVKFGSRFIDASVKTKLDQLERTLKGGSAAA